MEPPFGLGADSSKHDYRTLSHADVGAPQAKPIGGTQYPASVIRNQRKVGICTAISLVQNTEQATGVKYSADFQYLLQKHFIDQNWYEGSSPFASLQAAKKYGMLRIEHFPSIVDETPTINYADYIARLVAVVTDEVKFKNLLSKCEFPIKGYASVKTDDYSFAEGVDDSKAGLICRFNIGAEWWTKKNGQSSWSALDIEPLRAPAQIVSGHQVTVSDYDFTQIGEHVGRVANTWSKDWADDGSARFILQNYRPTEAWIPYYDFTPDYVPLPDPATWQHLFTRIIRLGDTGDEVKDLQVKLMMEDCLPRIKKDEWGTFGPKTRTAVVAFQMKRSVPLTYYERYVLRGSIVGPKTLKELNRK